MKDRLGKKLPVYSKSEVYVSPQIISPLLVLQLNRTSHHFQRIDDSWILNIFYIWSTYQIWSFGLAIWYLLFGHPVFIYLVVRFWSKVFVSNNIPVVTLSRGNEVVWLVFFIHVNPQIALFASCYIHVNPQITMHL